MIELPGLNRCPEDIPLIACHLLRKMATDSPDVAERFFPGGDSEQAPRITPGLIRVLVQRTWSTHVRELQSVLWKAVDASAGNYLEPYEGLSSQVVTAPPDGEGVPSAEIVSASLQRHRGVREKVWRDLGLRNRHVLARLIKKYGLES